MTGTSLRVQAFRSAGELPLFVAQDLGLFADTGLAVTVEAAAGSASQLRALETGECDLIHTAADNVLANLPGGDDVEDDGPCILAVLNRGMLRLVGGADVDRIEDLRGTRLGVDATSSGYVLVLRQVLASHGLAPDDYELLEIGGTQRRAEALRERRISATLVTPPFDLILQRIGCRELARAVDYLPGYIGSTIVARRSWVCQSSEVADAYCTAIVRATARILRRHDEGLVLETLQRRLDLDDELAASALQSVRNQADGLVVEAAIPPEALERLIRLRRGAGLDTRRSATDCLCRGSQ